jgi:precorrin-3B C17-methyltransferase
MRGKLVIVGLGPGSSGLVAPDAQAALADATDLIGYGPYLDRLALAPHQMRHASDNREEIERARHALALCASGRSVAVVSSGDAGVFAMASAVFEAMETGPASWRNMDVAVIPGISAMLAVSARLGAPLGHDFCAISLSDNLKPWALVCHRLQLAAEAGFVMALYNARSKARPNRLGEAFDVLRAVLPGEVLVVFATAISRADERVEISTLADADARLADMRTLVLIGARETRRIAGTEFLYTPRSVPV